MYVCLVTKSVYDSLVYEHLCLYRSSRASFSFKLKLCHMSQIYGDVDNSIAIQMTMYLLTVKLTRSCMAEVKLEEYVMVHEKMEKAIGTVVVTSKRVIEIRGIARREIREYYRKSRESQIRQTVPPEIESVP